MTGRICEFKTPSKMTSLGFVVAHRLRAIASFDQVIGTDNGRIAESGKWKAEISFE